MGRRGAHLPGEVPSGPLVPSGSRVPRSRICRHADIAQRWCQGEERACGVPARPHIELALLWGQPPPPPPLLLHPHSPCSSTLSSLHTGGRLGLSPADLSDS